MTQPNTQPVNNSEETKKQEIKKFLSKIEFSIQQKSYVAPVMKEIRHSNGGYLTYGDDNRYPDYLNNIFMGSSLHNAIVLRKVDEIVANGLYSASNNENINEFTDQCNRKGQSLNDLFRQCARDNEVYGGFAIQVIYTKGSTVKKPKIAELNYVKIDKLRFSLDCMKEDKPRMVVKYAKDWGVLGANRIKTIEYDLYNPQDPTGTKIFYYNGTLSRDWYPIPSYVGSIPAIEAQIEIANFNLNQLRNAFMPGLLVNMFNGEPTEEQKAAITRRMDEKWGGTSNAGKVIYSFNEADGKGIAIDKIDQPDLDKRYTNLQQTVRDEIFVGHRVTTPSIFGVQTAGKLGHGSEYLQGYSIFQNTYVKPQQRILLQVFNRLLKVNFKDCDLQIMPIEPINNVFTDEKLIASQMSSREIREKLHAWGYIDQVELLNGEKVVGITNVTPAPNKTNDETEPANNVPPANEENEGDSNVPE